jgi:uncharacterized membrane protein
MLRSYRALAGLVIGLLFGLAWVTFGFWKVGAVLFFALIGYLIGRALDQRARGDY